MSQPPFIVAVLADLGGRRRPLAQRRFVRIDRDNMDQVFERLAISTALDPDPLDGLPLPRGCGSTEGTRPGGLPLRFDHLEDFHPDRLLELVPRLAALVAARDGAPDPAWLSRLEGSSAEPETVAAEPPARPGAPGGAALLDSILDANPVARASGGSLATDLRTPLAAPPSMVARLAAAAVSGHLVSTSDSARHEWRSAVESVAGSALRAVLQAPALRQLEATWLSLRDLVLATETGPQLEIRVLDLSLDELRTEVATSTHRAGPGGAIAGLLEDVAGEIGQGRLGCIVAGFPFGASDRDAWALGALARVAERFACPVLVDGAPDLVGLPGGFEALARMDGDAIGAAVRQAFAGEWGTLAGSDLARRIVVAVPRVIARLPYGADTEPLAGLGFEEVVEPLASDPRAFVWGSAAMALARVIAREFTADGWDLCAEASPDLDGLPMFVYRGADGNSEVLPCAEVQLRGAAIQEIVDRGLVFLGSYRGEDRARFFGVQTLAGERIEFGL